ncbi:MAG: hypothetical protein M1832_004434 [Thelocarpon impressellum]|nr:MAG: hypothetical protein M1832_004434 [Thelocarpon impressellum]
MTNLEDAGDVPSRGPEMDPRDKTGPQLDADITPSRGGAPPTATLQDLTTRALDFLTSASNETLGGCVVGLVAATYFVLGRVGLLLIGILAGVVLHAGWEHSGREAGEDVKAQETRRRRDVGLDIVGRVLDWRDNRSKDDQNGDDGDSDRDQVDVMLSAQKTLSFSGFPPETASALTSLTDAIIRDYVLWWYAPILPGEKSFPTASKRMLTAFFLSVSSHLARKRPADTFLDFLTNSSSIVIVFLSELSNALSAGSTTTATPARAVHQYLEENPESNLASVLNIEHQTKKFNVVAEDILQSFLDPKTYNCEPARVFLREILAGVIMDMTVTKCSKPEWINGLIVSLLEDGEPELMNAIDVGMGGDATATMNGNGKVAAQSGTDGKGHQRRVSKAEEVMEEAMQEAQRLNRLIAEEDARKQASVETAERAPETDPGRVRSDSSLREKSNGPFTSFDQIIPNQGPTALLSENSPLERTSPTLYNANISIFDDSAPTDKGTVRSKPTAEYLLQIEPASSLHPGWMIARKYVDFETLHEVLRRISVVSGATGFTRQHEALPAWKGRTKANLREDLEKYVGDALKYRQLAESEGMKRFLEKDQAQARASPTPNKGGFGWANPASIETMGKGVIDVLASAPKGAAGGGKALLGGVSGVLGVGQKKGGGAGPQVSAIASEVSLPSKSMGSLRDSRESLANGSRTSYKAEDDQAYDSSRTSINEKPSSDLIRDSTEKPVSLDGTEINLPPPPSDMPDDYGSASRSTNETASTMRSSTSSLQPERSTAKPTKKPLTEQETRVAVELLFATINELYTLSSAWNIRRTLLAAAKTFLLRPGNPNLEAIRALLQSSLIEANTSDAGIASHLRAIETNALPTEDELKTWPPPPSGAEKERLKVKARKLLVERGLPRALTSVMGGVASGEALGSVFDCLQVESVARGLVFGLVLQAVRAVTQ